MDLSFPLYATARNNMVDSQVRPNKVTDPRLLDAMRRLPRELFVPPALAALAYVDEDIPLGQGRVLMQPLAIARLVQLARGRAGEKALVVGAGAGYGAALLAACGCVVTALEEDGRLIAMAQKALSRLAPAVRIVQGELAAGVKAGAPWDIILIEGAVAAAPPSLAAQVAHGGRLVTVLAAAGSVGHAVLGEPVGTAGASRLQLREMFDCSTPLLPSFRPAPAFVF